MLNALLVKFTLVLVPLEPLVGLVILGVFTYAAIGTTFNVKVVPLIFIVTVCAVLGAVNVIVEPLLVVLPAVTVIV
jgi:hypothetical protein